VPEPEPKDYYPEKINEFLEDIAKYTKQVYTPKWKEIKESELKEVKGLLHVDDKKDKIDETLRPIVQEEDRGIQKIIAKLGELRESGELPKVDEDEEEEAG
jgi:glutaredoxin 2